MPPRDVQKHKLTSLPLLIYSYILAGTILTLSCLLVYFLGYNHYGINANDLFTMNDKEDRYFPSVDNRIYHTSDGRDYDKNDQGKIICYLKPFVFLFIFIISLW